MEEHTESYKKKIFSFIQLNESRSLSIPKVIFDELIDERNKLRENEKIAEAVNEFLLKHGASRCIVEDEFGNIIFPSSKKDLTTFFNILKKRSEGTDEITVVTKIIDPITNEQDFEKFVFSYNEIKGDIVIDGITRKCKFKTLKNVSNEKDYLTGLDNRNRFIKKFNLYLESVLGRKGQFAYVFFDMNDFKGINDNYGHLVGDELLKKFGELVQKSIRTDDLAVRFGGDEFIVVLKNIDPSTAIIKTEEIIESFKLFDIKTSNNEKVSCSASAGICYVNTSLVDRIWLQNKDLFRDNCKELADIEMYKCKKSKKISIIHFDANEFFNQNIIRS